MWFCFLRPRFPVMNPSIASSGIPLHARKRTINTNSSAVQTEELVHKHVNANANVNDTSVRTVNKLCKEGLLKEALQILRLMDDQGVSVDFSTYVSLLQGCISGKTLPDGKLVHAHIIQTGFRCQDIFLGNTLLNMYTKCGSLGNALRVLHEMPKRNVVSWTVMIAAYAKRGCFEEALSLFYQMQRSGIQPNHFTFASVLPACANLATFEHGKEIHEEIIRCGFESDVFVGSALVDMYIKCGSIKDARNLFDKMPDRNIVSWTAMIAGYAQNGHLDEAWKLFGQMPERNVFSWNAVLAGYAQNGHVDEAFKIFQKMPERDVVSWNTLIAGYTENGRIDEATKIFQKMPERDVVSWNTMVAGYAQNGNVDAAWKLFQKMPKRDVISWTAMIVGYVQNGHAEEALELFWKMPERDAVSWTAMIAGYTQNGYFDKALKLFREMKLTGVKPNSDTFASILPACANLVVLEHGKVIHEDIIRYGFQSDVFVASTLVDMYAKCGNIEDARKVFGKMPTRDVVSWNAMIVSYAMHGCGMEALQLFGQMQHSGTNPNHVTFVGVLSACCHAGLVDDGWQYFNCMCRYYHITPTMDHYCCMVDLLGRAGLLDEAQDFISKMPIQPNADVWGSLLGACRQHTNIELGEHVAENLFKLDPKNAAPYVLLSNIYAEAGRWDEIERVRKMMKDRRIKKKPGFSWIEVNKHVYVFLSGDKSHPQMQQIYAKLKSLSGQMKEAGYVPETRYVLNNVEEEQKEHILFHHSEKLAIAFGLINVSSGTPIRIVKNLRVCGDCHSATKFISKIVAQEIVVRDANRFHHFKDGQCSCGDYW
eukprot:Gb_05982 [translate_table: standard]